MKISDRDVNAQLRIQSTILEMIALRGDLDDILAKLCILVQELIPSSVASLMLIDKATNRLNVRSAPGIPEEVRKCFDGLGMTPNSGSCGTAAYTGEMVIVEDTLTDPRWKDLRDLAHKIQKLACCAVSKGRSMCKANPELVRRSPSTYPRATSRSTDLSPSNPSNGPGRRRFSLSTTRS